MTRARDNSFNPFNNQEAGKNFIINGAFDFWQRGTIFTTSGAYCSDRWAYVAEGSSAGTILQQTTSLPAGFRYSLRCQRNSGNTGTAAIGISQAIESSISIPSQGRTVVLSYWAKAGANYSNSGSVLNVRINSGTGIDQGGGGTQFGGWSGYAEAAPNQVITTSWARYQATYNVPSNATQLGVRFMMYGVGTAGANDWFEITGVQIELGSASTLFSRAGGTIGGELSLCQRYYEQSEIYGLIGHAYSSTQFAFNYKFNTPKRIVPSVSMLSAGSYNLYSGNSTPRTMSSVGSNLVGLNQVQFLATVSNATTAGYSCHIDGGVSNAIVINAEL
jgi:hypothetical protein